MRIRRKFRSVSMFGANVFGTVIKAVVTSLAVGMFVVSIMHYLGLPVPSANDLLGGLSQLARSLS
ncbi:MAG TPA: hypothetical protein VJT15_11510 [Pyrinomonadaceae bacterium]|nr:hypothetical protein [Pyrinomonadaceae bacterium]